jgi:hypothetical protein
MPILRTATGNERRWTASCSTQPVPTEFFNTLVCPKSLLEPYDAVLRFSFPPLPGGGSKAQGAARRILRRGQTGNRCVPQDTMPVLPPQR